MAATLSLPFPPVRPDWLARTQEATIEPDRLIIDPHHHLWKHPTSGRYLLEDVADDLGAGHRVTATVFVQCGWNHRVDGPEAFRPVREAETVAAVAALSLQRALTARQKSRQYRREC